MAILKKKKDDIAHAKETARLNELARIEAERKRSEQKALDTQYRNYLLPPNNVHRWHPFCGDTALDVAFVSIDLLTSEALAAVGAEMAIFQQEDNFEKKDTENLMEIILLDNISEEHRELINAFMEAVDGAIEECQSSVLNSEGVFLTLFFLSTFPARPSLDIKAHNFTCSL
jgi:hypothetical protein